MSSTAPDVHAQIEQELRQHPAKRGVPFNMLVTAVEVGGSIALFQIARHQGASNVASYLIGSIGPVVGALMIWAKARRFSGASAAIFTFTVLSAVIALIGSTDSRVLLYKDCAATAVIALIFAASCLLGRRPLVFYMAQRYGTDGTHDGMGTFEKMWAAYRDFRISMYVISAWWAAVFLVQAAVTALIISRTSYSTGYDYDQILPLVAIGLGIVGSVVLGRHYALRGRARGAAARESTRPPG